MFHLFAVAHQACVEMREPLQPHRPPGRYLADAPAVGKMRGSGSEQEVARMKAASSVLYYRLARAERCTE